MYLFVKLTCHNVVDIAIRRATCGPDVDACIHVNKYKKENFKPCSENKENISTVKAKMIPLRNAKVTITTRGIKMCIKFLA